MYGPLFSLSCIFVCFIVELLIALRINHAYASSVVVISYVTILKNFGLLLFIFIAIWMIYETIIWLFYFILQSLYIQLGIFCYKRSSIVQVYENHGHVSANILFHCLFFIREQVCCGFWSSTDLSVLFWKWKWLVGIKTYQKTNSFNNHFNWLASEQCLASCRICWF